MDIIPHKEQSVKIPPRESARNGHGASKFFPELPGLTLASLSTGHCSATRQRRRLILILDTRTYDPDLPDTKRIPELIPLSQRGPIVAIFLELRVFKYGEAVSVTTH